MRERILIEHQEFWIKPENIFNFLKNEKLI